MQDSGQAAWSTTTCSRAVTWGKPLEADGAPRPAATRTPAIRGSTCSSARSARTRWPTSAARSATTGRGAPRPSSGPRTRPTIRCRPHDWKREHGWFDNHHWIFPMNPKRFAESMLPEVPSRRDRAGAERAVSRSAGPEADRRLPPDSAVRLLRLPRDQRLRRTEPPHRPRPAHRAELLGRGAGAAGQRRLERRSRTIWADELVAHPDERRARGTRCRESLRERRESCPASPDVDQEAGATCSTTSRRPGKLRKVGPSLRHVASKVDFDFLYSWIRKPSDFRPTHQDAAVLRAVRSPGRQGPGRVASDSSRSRFAASPNTCWPRASRSSSPRRPKSVTDEALGRARQDSCSRRAAAWPAISTAISRQAR